MASSAGSGWRSGRWQLYKKTRKAGKIDTTPLITHRYRLEDIEEAYHLFENKLDGVIKVAVVP